MKGVRRILSAALALVMLLGGMGWTPTRAEETALEKDPGTVTENVQALDSVDEGNILQYVGEDEFRSHEHVARLREEENNNSYVFLNRDGKQDREPSPVFMINIIIWKVI